MNVTALYRRKKVLGLAILIAVTSLSQVPMVQAGEHRIVLRDYVKQQWKNELVTYPFEAEKGQCHPDSIRLVGPKGPVLGDRSDIQIEVALRYLELSVVCIGSHIVPF